MTKLSRMTKLAITPALAALALAGAAAPAPAQAQIPGLLPSIDDVTPRGDLPIDGVWRIRENNELIAIEEGHAYAIDGWIHAFVFKIMPRQVVIRDLVETADGTFMGDDLPLMSRVELIPMDDGTLKARTSGLIPVIYNLEPADDPRGDDWEPIPGPGPGPDPDPDPIDDDDEDDDDWVSPW